MIRLNQTGLPVLLIFLFILCFSCKKEETIYENNTIPPYEEIPSIEVRNYVNRVYIDLIGREPTDEEMERDLQLLESNNLSHTSRSELVNLLMFNDNFIEGDSSYTNAYYNKLYEDTKARLIEGASDAEIINEYQVFRNNAIADSLAGNFSSYEQNMLEADKLKFILDSQFALRNGEITIREMYSAMLYNSIYDLINMGAFNFINASFNDLYFRFPTDAEFQQAFDIIEHNQPAQVFGTVAQTKVEFLEILVNTAEYDEGLIRWIYLSLLAREPETQEVNSLIGNLSTDNIQEVQLQILITDEYAGFE